MTRTSPKVGLSTALTAVLGLVAGVLGSAAFAYFRDARTVASVAPPPVVRTVAGDGSAAAALREMKSLLAAERARQQQEQASAQRPLEVGEGSANTQPSAEEEPELSLEEQGAAHVAEHEASLNAHNQEPRDRTWAPAAEASLLAGLNALPELGGRTTQVDCRSKTCTAQVEWSNYAAALAGYPQVLHANLQTNCSKSTVLPEPQDREQPYKAAFVFDCDSSERGGG
jgi:hypothetical protein